MRSSSRSRAGVDRDAPSVSAAITAYPSIADRANGGTSIGEVTSAAATRPPASSSGTRSMRAIGRTDASNRRRASSSEIVEVKGLIATRRVSLARLLHEMSELRDQQPLHREPHRRFRSGQRDDDVPGGDAGAGAAHHRRGSDLLEAEHAKELAEAVEPLLQQAG